MTPSVSRRRLLTATCGAVVAGTAGCLARSADSEPPDPTESTAATAADNAYGTVYEDAIDSVVEIRTPKGSGTGFAFDESHVVTNAHVVGTASVVEVRFADGQWRSGSVAGADAHSDLAAVAVEDPPSSATPLPFVDDPPAVGREVIAIGNPFDLEGTITTGIVSGVDRSIPAPTGYSIPDAIQTDAAVNPGNSGGPLLTLEGAVAAVINSGGGDNVGFGISAALTERVVPDLVEEGAYDHSFLGASFTDVTPAVASANDLADRGGLLVVDIVGGGPAAGVLEPSPGTEYTGRGRVPAGGDVLLAVNGTALATKEDLESYLALETRPGDTVELTVRRDGTERSVSLELGTRPARRGPYR
ncbi:S1C family serine protease [Natrinema thermotolerans]